jgi:A/G-specific adenine glycosylase
VPFPATSLLSWYDRHRRSLPWRAAPGQTVDPYHVWLSEIMLQQTTVAATVPYYLRFLTRFPTLRTLAGAPIEDVLAAWAGLGYYARARNLHACARAVAAGGGFPREVAGLRALPGIGDYTAAAIGAIAFGVPVVPVDGNVERVVARLFAVTEELPRSKPLLRQLATRLGIDTAARARPADFAQALFDLGATVCTPARPTCALCPWMSDCAGRRAGLADALPRRAAKRERPQRHGVHFWLADHDGNVLLRRRPQEGLLGGMTELPGTDWLETPWETNQALPFAPMAADWRPVGQVRHGFTHFTLTIELLAGDVARIEAPGMVRPIASLADEALPSVMRKCVRMVYHEPSGGRVPQRPTGRLSGG